MRLTPHQRQTIEQTLRRHFGPGARILLFGSRTDDRARGGDIDLYVEPDFGDPDRIVDAQLGALAELHQALGEQKIDLVVRRPGAELLPIHRVAKTSGIPL
jgi:predicted nucleotidyltransferase